jgi:calcium-dependent protein kinase
MGNCTSKSTVRKHLKQSSAILSPKKTEIKKSNFRINYKIEDKLSEESNESIFLLIDKITSENRVLRSIQIDQENASNTIIEIQQLQQLDHPNLVNIIEVYQEAHFVHVIYEHCTGGELFEKITRRRSLPQDILLKYMKEIASGLVYLHSVGISHNHLIPEEIFFVDDSEESSIKISGIGKSFDENSSRLYRAPETFSENYFKSSDIWSFGVILYIMACGKPPFQDISNEQEFFLHINTAQPSFSERAWYSFSPSLKNLIISMLNKNYEERPTAREIIQSEIIQETQSAEKVRISSRTLKHLCKFTKKSKFKRALLSFLVQKTSIQNKVNHFISVFKSMDVNGDGMLSSEEILEGLKSTGAVISNPIQIIKSIDTDKSGVVSYSEFITALVDWEQELTEEKLKKAFMELDVNGDGLISIEEIANAIGKDVEDKELINFMKEADSNQDGSIDFQEFRCYLKKKDE